MTDLWSLRTRNPSLKCNGLPTVTEKSKPLIQHIAFIEDGVAEKLSYPWKTSNSLGKQWFSLILTTNGRVISHIFLVNMYIICNIKLKTGGSSSDWTQKIMIPPANYRVGSSIDVRIEQQPLTWAIRIC